jgi:hypothetical protein
MSGCPSSFVRMSSSKRPLLLDSAL